MKSLTKQVIYEFERFDIKKESIETVFIGGGTPSTVPSALYKDMFLFLKPYLQKNFEFSIEANPNSADISWIKNMKDMGINRISFGVQSFDDKKLEYLGRNHSSSMAKKAIENAYDIGLKNISIDLIHGVKNDTKKLLKKDIDTAFSLPINHISTYHLSIEKDTIFYKNQEKAKENEKEQRWLYNEIKKRGFTQYEISNFGKYLCRHNLGYWKHQPYIGIGAGAVGFIKNRRFYPYKNIEKYIKNPIFHEEEILSSEDIKIEKIFLGLRSIVGFDKNILNSNEIKKTDMLLKEKKIKEKNGRIYNTDYLLSDEITLFISS